ncbi:MAG: voltage-gated potassium channel Kch [Myxococcota bacterium]|jgi:voltage-gated potassium channel Kch
MAFVALMAGVGVSDRTAVADADVLTKIYYALGLFVLGGLDLGVPVGGGEFARSMLWVAYFAAPAISFAALIEGILRAIRPHAWLLRRLDDHIVIGGCGRLAMLYLQRLRETNPTVTVVIVEKNPNQSLADVARERYQAHVVSGDIADADSLKELRIGRARRALLLTDNDLINLDAAAEIVTLAPHLADRTAVHVSDIRTMRVLDLAGVERRCEMFNTHKIAAEHLVDSSMLQHFEQTIPKDVVVLAGFGRFGQTVLYELQTRAPGAFETVVIMDMQAALSARVFDDQVGFQGSYARDIVDADMRDPAVWEAIDGRHDLNQREAVILVGCSDDTVNVRTALVLKRRFPKARVIARGYRRSRFAEQVAKEAGFNLIAVSELAQESFPDAWFV